MTLVYDPNGAFLSGMLMGDSDTSWTVSKGIISSYAVIAGAAAVHYSPGGTGPDFILSDFVKQTALNEYTPLATWVWDDSAHGYYRNGQAYFQLKLQQ